MSIIDRFMEDHRAFRLHLEGSRRRAEGLAPGSAPPPPTEDDRKFYERLRRHARMESECLFPRLQRAANEGTRDQIVKQFISHGIDEHASVAKRQATLTAAPHANTPLDAWRKALAYFAEGLERHMEMEERDIFPVAQKLLSQDVLAELNQKAESIQ